MGECIFCRIVEGSAPAHVVHRSRGALAFLDVAPAAPGHTLVIPEAHHPDIYAMTPEAMAEVARAAREVALVLREVLRPDGLTVTQANGPAAGQSVGHYHLHLIPRRMGERLRMHGTERAGDEALAAMAERLRAGGGAR